jgi:hypothetical protein
METRTHSFGTFKDLEQTSAAVDRLIAQGFASSSITVLLRENPSSVEFARMKGTRVPVGTEHGPRAEEPVEGSLGIMYPGEGPKRGVLDDALDAMGVPLDWPHGVQQGSVLISIESDDTETAVAALEEAGATRTGSATLRPAAV